MTTALGEHMNRQVQVIGIGVLLHQAHAYRLEDAECRIGLGNRRNTVFVQGGSGDTPMDPLAENGFYMEDRVQQMAAVLH